jgi:type III pantothenate kinase
MDLTIDFGNTSTKIGVFENQKLTDVLRFKSTELNLDTFVDIVKHNNPQHISFLHVTQIQDDILNFLMSLPNTIHFTHHFTLPFVSEYVPYKNIGIDRIAGVLGATVLYPENNLLIIQAGTCITYDVYLMNKGHIGGIISPGLDIRNRAMNTFTYQLPYISLCEETENDVIGNTTFKSLSSGIVNGAIFEMQGFIEHIQNLHNVKVIISGGDMKYFVKRIKSPIFANQNITLFGLKEIIQLYVQKP